MDTYIATLNRVGDSIVAWADPDNKYTGYTDVSEHVVTSATAGSSRFSLTWWKRSSFHKHHYQSGLASD